MDAGGTLGGTLGGEHWGENLGGEPWGENPGGKCCRNFRRARWAPDVEFTYATIRSCACYDASIILEAQVEVRLSCICEGSEE